MSKNSGFLITLGVLGGMFLGLLNVAAISFYALWMNADQWFVNRSESSGGFDPSQLPPLSGATWLAAQGTALSLLAVDAIAITAIILLVRSAKTADARTPVAANSQPSAQNLG